ncbi:MAG: trehalose-phosphatase [Acidimicrobiia bacterium]
MDPLRALPELARAPSLLVVCDYDGTLSPIVDDPARAFPQAGAIEALRGLAEVPGTRVMVVSGRALADLTRLTGPLGEIGAIGSHGAEPGFTPAPAKGRDRIVAELEQIAARFAGSRLEVKPAGVAFHYRQVAPERLEKLLEALGRVAAPSLKHGKKVVELSAVEADKGSALDQVRGESVVAYLGDDLTDEDAFARLREGDVGIKVGEGESLAPYRLADPAAAVRFLRGLARARAKRFLPPSGGQFPPPSGER